MRRHHLFSALTLILIALVTSCDGCDGVFPEYANSYKLFYLQGGAEDQLSVRFKLQASESNVDEYLGGLAQYVEAINSGTYQYTFVKAYKERNEYPVRCTLLSAEGKDVECIATLPHEILPSQNDLYLKIKAQVRLKCDNYERRTNCRITDNVSEGYAYLSQTPSLNLKRAQETDPNFDQDWKKYGVELKYTRGTISVGGPLPKIKPPREFKVVRITIDERGMRSMSVERVATAVCEPNYGQDWFSCSLAVTEADFEGVFRLAVGAVTEEGDPPDTRSTPHLFMSEYVDEQVWLEEIETRSRPNASRSDHDSDGALDNTDNCVLLSNSEQEDIDGDNRGDVCDNDIDHDGLINDKDNCPSAGNSYQEDADGDGLGDVCDDLKDTDKDGVGDDVDNCPEEPGVADKNGCPLDPDDPDDDGIKGADDQCENTPEVYDPLSGNPTDGVADGCPGSSGNTNPQPPLNKGEDETPPPTPMESGTCSLASGATANPLIFLLIGFALAPLAVKRRR